MRVTTVFYSYKRMLERNGHHIDARLMNGRKTKTKITPPVAKMLLSQETLQAWSGLFLSQRVAKLRSEHDVDISASGLKQFYKKHKVKFLKVIYQYYQALKKGPEERFNFAVRLSQLLEFDEPIVYMDEASFHLWLRKTHTWTYSERPVRIVLGQNRCSGITVFGAIGAHMDLPAFSLETGTTGEAFGRFLKKIRVWMDTDRKLYLVLDNAPAHRTQVNRDLAARLDIELLYMPPYTPELNSIEPLWSVIKRDFKSCAESRNMVRMQQEDFHTLLQECLDHITPEVQSKAARHNNRAYLHQCMGDMIEWRKKLDAEGAVPGIDPEDVESADEGQATYEVRWPPNGDPLPSDQLEHSVASRQQSIQA
jgi:transposase